MKLELMEKLCGVSSEALYRILSKYLFRNGYKRIWREKTYILAEGNIPICLVAHMDTVFSHQVHDEDFIYDPVKQVLWHPHGAGFDDRAGIYAILDIIQSGYRPHIIFTDLEERGGIGASDVVEKYPDCPFKDCKCLIQLDRANEKDAVFYSCDNEEFAEYIETFGFVEDWGTFSDISILAPNWKIAAVNLSVGYLEEHTGNERLHCDWLEATIERVKKILDNADNMAAYKYIPYVYTTITTYNKYMKPKYMSIKQPGRCSFCDAVVNNDKEGCYINEGNYNYIVCNPCFSQYFYEGAF